MSFSILFYFLFEYILKATDISEICKLNFNKFSFRVLYTGIFLHVAVIPSTRLWALLTFQIISTIFLKFCSYSTLIFYPFERYNCNYFYKKILIVCNSKEINSKHIYFPRLVFLWFLFWKGMRIIWCSLMRP